MRFIKEQEASGLLISSGIKASLNQVPLAGPVLLLNVKLGSQRPSDLPCVPKISDRKRELPE